MLLGLPWRSNAADATASKEYQIKAAYLYNFIKFVEWPAERFATETAPVIIGVLGHDPFGGELEKIVRGRQANGRVVATRVVTSADDARAVHLLFVPAQADHLFATTAALLRETAVVTVGESDRFAELGGMIVFTREADKVRFAINLGAAAETQVKLSAQLLKLATEVRRKS